MGQVITISGSVGSGKSTVAKMLAQKLGWQYYSTGMAQRKIAEEMGLTTLELNELTNRDKSIDDRIDAVFQNPPWGQDSCVVDSRLAFHFLPQSFKVCLTVDAATAGKRILNDLTRSGERKYNSIDDATQDAIKRRQIERDRFKKIYKIDIAQANLFDLVIDTTNLSTDLVCQEILTAFKKN